MNRGEIAKQNFSNGNNCAQATLLAFSDLTGLDEATAMKLASSFGGGMGRLREVCGAVSGMFMALGLIYGDSDVPTHENKVAHYQRVQELAARFKEKNGSIICRELLDGVQTTHGVEPEKRTDQYYTKRPCGELCACAAEILQKYIEENPI
ncbi:MAG: C_GCAxxG_C_C family protein [Ruminococcaceae bacterium]|nr:C_GCAxxG_C_C family protein [Oscillospiraceae bacterium]